MDFSKELPNSSEGESSRVKVDWIDRSYQENLWFNSTRHGSLSFAEGREAARYVLENFSAGQVALPYVEDNLNVLNSRGVGIDKIRPLLRMTLAPKGAQVIFDDCGAFYGIFRARFTEGFWDDHLFPMAVYVAIGKGEDEMAKEKYLLQDAYWLTELGTAMVDKKMKPFVVRPYYVHFGEVNGLKNVQAGIFEWVEGVAVYCDKDSYGGVDFTTFYAKIAEDPVTGEIVGFTDEAAEFYRFMHRGHKEGAFKLANRILTEIVKEQAIIWLLTGRFPENFSVIDGDYIMVIPPGEKMSADMKFDLKLTSIGKMSEPISSQMLLRRLLTHQDLYFDSIEGGMKQFPLIPKGEHGGMNLIRRAAGEAVGEVLRRSLKDIEVRRKGIMVNGRPVEELLKMMGDWPKPSPVVSP